MVTKIRIGNSSIDQCSRPGKRLVLQRHEAILQGKWANGHSGALDAERLENAEERLGSIDYWNSLSLCANRQTVAGAGIVDKVLHNHMQQSPLRNDVPRKMPGMAAVINAPESTIEALGTFLRRYER